MTSLLNFQHKAVLVTGGGQGIGYGIVEQFARLGASVIMADVNPAAESAAEKLRADGVDAHFVPCDVSVRSDVRALAEFAERQYGGADVLVNNAGIFPRGDLFGTDEALWDSVLNINLKGMFLVCQAVVPAMRKKGGGNIVNIGSLHARQGQPDTLAYAVSKGGVVTLTTNLAAALAPYHIRVNCVHPGWVASEGEVDRWRQSNLDIEKMEEHFKNLPFGRIQQPSDIALAVVSFASELSGQVTGQFVTVDGGMSLRRG